MNPNFRRAAIKRRLVEVAEQTVGEGVDLGVAGRDEETVTVSYDWSGDIEGDSAIYFGDISGDAEPESVGANPLTEDRFSIDFRLTVWGFQSPQEADEAAERTLNAFAAPLRSLNRLIGDEVPSTEMPPVDGRSPFDVQSVTVVPVDGPLHSFPESDGDDISAAINGVIRCVVSIK